MSYALISLFLVICCCKINDVHLQGLLDRQYTIFPKGSTFSVQICMTIQMGIAPGSIFTNAVNWGVNYPLEIKEKKEMTNDTDVSDETMVRRERRSLFKKIEKLFFHMGYDGRHCILRALCEYSSEINLGKKTIVNELLRVFFRYTTETLMRYESREDRLYHQAQINGELSRPGTCFDLYPKCHFSLLNLLLGYHSPEILLNSL
ncbi:hypothetical protein WA026_000054 [Henosepilachna vigintioctopunctata]|uniref:Uncharacterized protein n=1 Tax=Henosepilachna vigintioctopunctata TaxID=420089 RepID=A0AAW1UY21_9CUCU